MFPIEIALLFFTMTISIFCFVVVINIIAYDFVLSYAGKRSIRNTSDSSLLELERELEREFEQVEGNEKSTFDCNNQ